MALVAGVDFAASKTIVDDSILTESFKAGCTGLGRALHLLAVKRLVAATAPLSTRPSRETRYAVADPYLRFWLSFVGPYLPEIERGRGDLTLARVRRSWTSWRGRAIEPVVREAMRRLPGDQLPPPQADSSIANPASHPDRLRVEVAALRRFHEPQGRQGPRAGG